jgi:S1-C subfamily serine protease
MSGLRSLSDDLAAIVRAATPSLVRVRGARRPATATLWRADGLAVLAAHVLGPRDEGTVEVGGESVAARVIGRAPSVDLALLKLDLADAPLLERREADQALAVGELVVSLGHPGPSVGAALGMLSTLGDAWRPGRRGRHHDHGPRIDAFIDVDGGLPAGFSGGPLVDVDGKLIGINTHGLIRGGTTLPLATVDRIVEALLERGSGPMGYLGVAVQRAPLQPERSTAAGQEAGLLVTSLVDDGPGQDGGILVGDVLLTVAGDAVDSVGGLFEALAGRGDTEVAVTLMRGDRPETLTMQAGVRPRGHRRGRGRGPRHDDN